MPASPHALMLFAHGSPDPEWAAPFVALQDTLTARHPELIVALAYLPPAKPDFAAVIDQLHTAGVARVTVAPVFLARGGHIKRDLPEMTAAAEARYGMTFKVLPTLGESAQLIEAMAAWIGSQVDATAN